LVALVFVAAVAEFDTEMLVVTNSISFRFCVHELFDGSLPTAGACTPLYAKLPKNSESRLSVSSELSHPAKSLVSFAASVALVVKQVVPTVGFGGVQQVRRLTASRRPLFKGSWDDLLSSTAVEKCLLTNAGFLDIDVTLTGFVLVVVECFVTCDFGN
jgi:hypothetical protein